MDKPAQPCKFGVTAAAEASCLSSESSALCRTCAPTWKPPSSQEMTTFQQATVAFKAAIGSKEGIPGYTMYPPDLGVRVAYKGKGRVAKAKYTEPRSEFHHCKSLNIHGYMPSWGCPNELIGLEYFL